MGTMLACVALAAGCGRGPQVQSELPIKRVVVYRNGVAYFERAGHVDRDDVRFKMRQTEVGDFLATLAVMEQGGSSVRSAAFPLKDDSGKAKDPKEEDKDTALRTVVLSLDGRAHDLQVGYIAAAPVWRPSYRLVVQPDGQADLQAWGIVQNLSGEDWTEVQLSLVAGAPLAFEAQLGTPIIPDAPDGDRLGRGHRVDAQGRDERGRPRRGRDPRPDGRRGAGEAEGARHPDPSPAPAAAPAPTQAATGSSAKEGEDSMGNPNTSMPRREGYVQPSQPRNVHSLAAVAVQGGTTRYDIPAAITIPDKNATMVMLLARRVHGEAIFLFAPDDGVPDSTSHPFHVVRFENETSGVLERGPIAVFQQGSFLGQGLLDPLPTAGWATVPFALERAIGIDAQQKTDVQGTRISKIENGILWLEHDSGAEDDLRDPERRRAGGQAPREAPAAERGTPLPAAAGDRGQRRDGQRARAGVRPRARQAGARRGRARGAAGVRRLVRRSPPTRP